MEQITDPVLSAIFSNLSKAAEKQDRTDEAALFAKLSGDYWKPDPTKGGFEALRVLVEKDLNIGYTTISKRADELPDSGAQRCVKWGEKVTSIQKSLLNRYESKGEALFDHKNVYVCEACGFIALAGDIPETCPVCKAPKSRFSKIQ